MVSYQDLLKVSDLGAEDALNTNAEGAAALEDLLGNASDTDFSDLDATVEKGVAELSDEPAGAVLPQTISAAEAGMLNNAEITTEGVEESIPAEPEQNPVEIPTQMPEEGQILEENNISEADTEMEQELNEIEQNVQEPAHMDAAADPQADSEAGAAALIDTADTAVITAGMSITGDVASSGNMDLIGKITGNIEILGKLNVTGGIAGNSSAAEIYVESARVDGDLRSKGSVKIGQGSLIFGNIFATSAVIAGAVNGDIDVHGPVILDTTAVVMGNIKSRSVQINDGASIEGMCSQCYADVSPSAFFDDIKKKRNNSNDKNNM